MPRGLEHNSKGSNNVDVSFEYIIGLSKFTGTQGFLSVPISWYQRIEQRQITESYRRYMEFDIAFETWVKVLPDRLKLSNFLSLDPVFSKTKIICFWFQTMKNDWVWRKIFERFITILNVSVDIIQVLFFQVLSIFEKLHPNFSSFRNETYVNNILIRYMHLSILHYPLQYAKRLVT